MYGTLDKVNVIGIMSKLFGTGHFIIRNKLSFFIGLCEEQSVCFSKRKHVQIPFNETYCRVLDWFHLQETN